MVTELIITEKPSQSLKIAEALADKKPSKKTEKGVVYYELKHKGKDILVGCAVGHIFNLKEKKSNGWTYPTYDYEWQPSYKISKDSSYTKKYLDVLKKLSKLSGEFTVACDYDLEGSLIGYNIIRFICNKKDGRRMKFSTLTKDELVNSYEKALKHLDFPLIESGEARHMIDFLFGINLSRALTLSVKNATKRFKILSTGRVQGPSLKILAEREIEINKFKSEPFWELESIGDITSKHEKGMFWKEEEVKKIHNKIKKEKKAVVDSIKKSEFPQAPPFPFDLTSLQLEAYRSLRINPKDTLEIAQELYSASYISYPRTSSNQLPPSINIKKILTDLSKQKEYKELCEELLKENKLTPNNGKKQDPAHPAIHPTGVMPKKLDDRQSKIYDLIVRRTLASLAEPAKRETQTVKLIIKNEPFITKGTRTIEKGWHKFYGRHNPHKEEELPKLTEKQEIKVKKINLLAKETQPPKRYTPASIIKELEKRELGTKATRSAIIESLYNRNYVKDQSLEVTDLGLKTVETLDKYCPEILDEKMTRDLEEDMEEIREGKETKEKVIDRAKRDLDKILKHFKENEIKIGKELSVANQETLEKESIVGKCPECKKNDLRIMYSRRFKSYFVACSGYPKCKTTFSLPNYALPKPTDKLCEECKSPLVLMIRKGKRPYEYCINKQCPKKEEWLKQQQKIIKKKSK
ncbi:DNA topoisomerase I [Candidatus Woesearchaeota archaeon]|nr:DNA topoisomerase I [Candidatus Woesearchaeota archaeon]